MTPKMKEDLKNINLKEAAPWEIDKALFSNTNIDQNELDKRVDYSKEFREKYNKENQD